MGASYQRVSKQERRRLEAAAGSCARNGRRDPVPHRSGHGRRRDHRHLRGRRLACLRRLILAHLDRNPDPELHVELARGASTWSTTPPAAIKYRPDSELLRLISEVVGAGFGDRILLGLDLGRRDYFRAYDGGPGMRYLLNTFAPRLERRIGAEQVRRILVDNPATAFALARAQ